MNNNNLPPLLLLLLNAFLLYSCTKTNRSRMIITGDVKNIPAKKIYLTDAYQWDRFLDSSMYENDKFQFVLDTSKFHEPFLASLCILNDKNEIQQLGIINYKRTTSKDTFSNSGFVVCWGNIELFGDYNDRFHRVSMLPNNENDLYFAPETAHFASNKNLTMIKKAVREHSSSYFLLHQLYNFKHFYTSGEIKDILELFNKELQNSTYASEISQYAGFLTERNAPFPNPVLTNSKEENILLFNDNVQLYMLVFWASWCAPCRMEIPHLKMIHNSFPSNLLSIKSISIDDSASNWLAAIKEENMSWQQSLIPNKDLLKIKAQFSVNAVPTVVFVDTNRREIKRFIGYDKKTINEYSDFINQYLRDKKK